MSSLPIALEGSARALDRSLVRGVSWTAGVKGATLLLSWVSTVIVARILSPADYGLVAMATVYIGLTTMITDFGIGSAIIALRECSDEVASQLHVLSAVIGLTGFAVSCAAAVPLSKFFRTPALVAVLIALASALVFDSLRTVPVAMLGRQLRFKALALLEAGKVIVAVAFTLALAAAGRGYWSLVLGNVIASIVMTIIVLIVLPQRLLMPQFGRLKSVLRFSSNFLMGQLAWYGYSNADFIVAGRVLGRLPLGEYTLAWTLTSAPADKIMAVFGRVMPTMLAAAQRDAQALRRYFLLFTEALALLIVPAATGLALVAPDFVPLVFGAKWNAAVMPLQLLCFYSVIHILGTPTAPVLQVSGQASFPARCGVATLLILPPAFYFCGARWGTIGVAAVWLSIYPFVLIPVFVRVFKTLELRVRDYARSIAPAMTSGVVMTAIVWTTRSAASHWTLAPRFAVEVATGAAAFLISIYLFERNRLGVLREFIQTIRS